MRAPLLDLVRAGAVLLMVLDHIAAVYSWPPFVRDLTRVALPMFMVLSGFLWSGALSSRYWWAVFAAVASWPAALLLNVAVVHVLAVYVLVLPVLLLPFPYLVAVGCLGLLQAYNWPIHWGGYQPGYVLAFLVIGVLLRRAVDEVPHWRVPPVLTLPGRYPLSIYVAHLWALLAMQ